LKGGQDMVTDMKL